MTAEQTFVAPSYLWETVTLEIIIKIVGQKIVKYTFNTGVGNIFLIKGHIDILQSLKGLDQGHDLEPQSFNPSAVLVPF